MKVPIRDRILFLFFGFKRQLLIYYTVVSIFVLALGSAVGVAVITNILKSQNERYVLLQFQQSDNNIRNFFNEVDRLTNLLLQDADVKQLLQEDEKADEYSRIANRVAVIRKMNGFLDNYYSLNSIYLYTEAGGAVGTGTKNSLSVNVGQADVPFLNSSIYRDAVASNPRITWHGAYKASFFNDRIGRNGGDNIPLISAAKKSGLAGYGSRTGIVVFNFDEKYLSSIYSGSLASKDSLMYIVDGTGTIISSSNGENIGLPSDMTAGGQLLGEDGSFTMKRGNVVRQVVHYKIRQSDWRLIEEMPLSLFAADTRKLQTTQTGIFIFSLLFLFIVSLFWTGRITRPLKILADKIREMSQGNLGVIMDHAPRNEMGVVIERFNEMSRNIAELMNRNEKIQKEKRELEIEALLFQINPHFLYNTLNMIKWMAAIIKAGNIVDAITALGNILKPVFGNTGETFTLQEELDYVGNYIKIMNWRFGNGVNFRYDIHQSYMDYRIPRFILQPLIENAITHGMKKPDNKIAIDIGVEENDEALILFVSDTGIGIPNEKMEEMNRQLLLAEGKPESGTAGGIGLTNVDRRIRLRYGEAYGISIENQDAGGTKISIRFPKQRIA